MNRRSPTSDTRGNAGVRLSGSRPSSRNRTRRTRCYSHHYYFKIIVTVLTMVGLWQVLFSYRRSENGGDGSKTENQGFPHISSMASLQSGHYTATDSVINANDSNLRKKVETKGTNSTAKDSNSQSTSHLPLEPMYKPPPTLPPTLSPKSSPPPQPSVLTELYRVIMSSSSANDQNSTTVRENNGLLDFANDQVTRVYVMDSDKKQMLPKHSHPNMSNATFPRSLLRSIKVFNPSLAYHEALDLVVMGFRVDSDWTGKQKDTDRLPNRQNYLLMCTFYPKYDNNDTLTTTATKSSQTDSNEYDVNDLFSYHCQDSGIDEPTHPYIPPQCDPEFFYQPKIATFFGTITAGPEDARLYFLEVTANPKNTSQTAKKDDTASSLMLGATFTMRGCHLGSKYNDTSPLYSSAMGHWVFRGLPEHNGMYDIPIWEFQGNPVLLDLRHADGSSLGEKYPSVSKSWIHVPSSSTRLKALNMNDQNMTTPTTREIGLNSTDVILVEDYYYNKFPLNFVVGFTKKMKETIVYSTVSPLYQKSSNSIDKNTRLNGYDTLVPVYPVTKPKGAVDSQENQSNPLHLYSEENMADLHNSRSSTNIIPFHGALLSTGHSYIEEDRTEDEKDQLLGDDEFDKIETPYHFWYLMCPNAPHRVIGRSDPFLLPGTKRGMVSFACGLAMVTENRENNGGEEAVYISWSKKDKIPILSRTTSNEIFEQISNSSFARESGLRSPSALDDLSLLCY